MDLWDRYRDRPDRPKAPQKCLDLRHSTRVREKRTKIKKEARKAKKTRINHQTEGMETIGASFRESTKKEGVTELSSAFLTETEEVTIQDKKTLKAQR